MNYINPDEIKKFFIILNNNEINYILIKNIADELPNSLMDGKDIDILVYPDSKTQYEEVMKKNNYHAHTHPLGIQNGWTFGYSLPEYQFWKKEDRPFSLYIDANFILCCKSFVPKTWVPLNRPINDSVWENKIFDDKNEWWIMDDKNMLLYLLVRCIFDKNSFSDSYIFEIEKRKHFINKIDDKLRMTFYKYSTRLSELVMMGKYGEIIQDYIAFDNY